MLNWQEDMYVLPCVDIIDIVPFVEQGCVKWDGTRYRYHEHYQHTLLHVLYPVPEKQVYHRCTLHN